MRDQGGELKCIAIFCGKQGCSCPTLWFDHSAPAERRLVLQDDFGQSARFSVAQFKDLISQAVDGGLTALMDGLD